MNAMTKLEAAVLIACINCAVPTNASAWWDDDDYDRWYDGPWYGGYPGYGWGGYPGYGWGGYPGYGYGVPYAAPLAVPAAPAAPAGESK